MEPRAPQTMINNSSLQNDRPKGQGEEDSEPKHHGGAFGNYMAYKNQKLHEQFSANAAVTRQSNLFQGVGIYVNGWTSPSHSELKQLMATHGGRFENYYSRSTVTHIICTNLPDAKVKQFEKERSPTPVVKPDWIVHSIGAGKLLPIQEYILWQLRGGPGQRTLQDVFAPAGGVEGAGAVAAPQPPSTTIETNQAATVAAVVGGTSTFNHQNDSPRDNHISGGTITTITTTIPTHETNNNNNIQTSYDPAELAAAQEIAAQMRADCDNLKGPPRSSKDDPNFVESFYRASRLHFIGTWKARLEALMASSVAIQAPAPAPYTLGGGSKRVILHLDMDCFFASVAEAGHPEFKGKPLAVCHSNSARGSGELSSANYEARKHGVGASMFMSRAKELCPGLIVVPYEFDKYEKVSEQVYQILLKYTSVVQPVSCDEAFLDITGLGDPEKIAASIRSDIYAATQCTASAGIGPNILLARIATRKAKPNGIFNLTRSTCGGTATTAVLPFLAELSVEDLPGVGWSTKRKLEELGIHTVADIHTSSKATLQTELGTNAGALLWDFAHGRDSRRVEGPKPRRSVGAEVNWGVRFESPEDPEKFVASLALEVASRMQQGGVRGRTITLKLKRKKLGWTEPVKFLGMGACDSFSKSVTLASMTAAAEDLEREGKVLLRMLRVPFDEIRGMGLTVTRLDTTSGSFGSGPVGGNNGIDTAVAAAGVAAPDIDAHGPSAGGVLEGSEASDAGWDIDVSESDLIPHKKQQQKVLDVSPSSNAARTAGAPAASPSPSPSGRGTKRKSPSGGKQVSLLDIMPPPPPRTSKLLQDAAAAAAGEEEEDELDEERERMLHPSARRELLAKYEGLSLTQIDADELAALPYLLQRELVSRLPRTRENTNTTLSNNGGGGGKIAFRKPSSPPPSANAVAAVPAAQEASGSKIPPRDKEVVVPKYSSKAPIEPLPAFSQLDQSVLDALPLQMRRELEAAYGTKRTIKAIDTTAAAAGSRRRWNHSPPKFAGGGGSSKAAQHDPKLRRLDAFVTKPIEGPNQNNKGTNNNSTNKFKNHPALNITLSQIDPGVLHELPHEFQDEVLRQLQPFPSSKPKAAAAGARKAVEARSAAAEATRQRQQLEDLQAAQVEGASLDNLNENEEYLEQIIRELEEFELPPAVKMLMQLVKENDTNKNQTCCVTVAEVLDALSAAVEEVYDLDDMYSQPSQSEQNQSSQASPQQQQQRQFHSLLPRAVMAAVSQVCKFFIHHDLEGTRKLLMRIKRIGEKYSSFLTAAEVVVETLQQRVQRRYGSRVSLTSIL